jgi:hypothetical protein
MRAIFLMGAMTCMAAAAAAPVTIVEDGEPRAAIVLHPEASGQLAEAVGEMQALIERASGAKLRLVDEAPEGRAAIHIGPTDAVDLAGLDGDGFVIEFPDERTIVIAGPTDWGTEFGVCEFLERYVGVRWLMPGDAGTYTPELTTITIPDEAVREEPAFFSRKFFGLRLDEQQLWARRNRLHSRIEFHHQLYRLFPRSDVEEHPEFFPIHDGERYLPAPDQHHSHWQPCFTAEGVVDVAVERIVDFFDEHPEAESYSLGVNDSGGHCECADCRALDPGRTNMVGKDHLTDRYITWANAVVEGVLAEHPDKWFGFLAYSEIFEPPDRVEMHPRLIPYMTYDRMQWIDPEAREASKELTKRWTDAAGTLGWYDYIYGAAYLVPRVYPHLMGEYYRFGHENGVRGLTAEAYPNFGEGPKLYVSLKLQWDPYQDVDALLDEWCTLAVGEEAAPYVRSYYDHWEDFWTRRILESDWWREGRQYLPFNSPIYLLDVTEDEIAQSREWLEAAVANAGTERQKARAELLLRAFEYYEASALSYPRDEVVPELATEAQAVAWMRSVAQRSAMVQKRRDLATEEFEGHPMLHHCMSIDRYPTIAGTDWVAHDLWSLYDWASRSEAVRETLVELTAEDAPRGVRMHAETMLATLDSTAEELTVNPSFEEGDGARAADWSYWLQEQVGSLTRSEEAAHSGEFGLIAEGVQYGGPHQPIPYEPGRYCVTVKLFVPEGQPEGGFVDVTLKAVDADHGNLPPGGTASFTPEPGRWVTAATVLDARDVPTATAFIRPGVWARNFPEGKVVYMDDVRMIRLED